MAAGRISCAGLAPHSKCHHMQTVDNIAEGLIAGFFVGATAVDLDQCPLQLERIGE
jgi:hypothetical protein